MFVRRSVVICKYDTIINTFQLLCEYSTESLGAHGNVSADLTVRPSPSDITFKKNCFKLR